MMVSWVGRWWQHGRWWGQRNARSNHLAVSGLTVRLPVWPGVCEAGTKMRGASNMNILYDVTGLLTAAWRSHSGRIVWAAWINCELAREEEGGGGFWTHSTYTGYPGSAGGRQLDRWRWFKLPDWYGGTMLACCGNGTNCWFCCNCCWWWCRVGCCCGWSWDDAYVSAVLALLLSWGADDGPACGWSVPSKAVRRWDVSRWFKSTFSVKSWTALIRVASSWPCSVILTTWMIHILLITIMILTNSLSST